MSEIARIALGECTSDDFTESMCVTLPETAELHFENIILLDFGCSLYFSVALEQHYCGSKNIRCAIADPDFNRDSK